MSCIGLRELISARRHALFQLFCPVEHHVDLRSRGLSGRRLSRGDGRHEPAIRGDVVRPSNVWASSGKWTWQGDRVPEGEGRLRHDADRLELAGSRVVEELFCVRRPHRMLGLAASRRELVWDAWYGREGLHGDRRGGPLRRRVRDPWPSGENTAPVRVDEWTLPKGVGFLSVNDSIHSDTSEPFVTLNSSVSPYNQTPIHGPHPDPTSSAVSPRLRREAARTGRGYRRGRTGTPGVYCPTTTSETGCCFRA